MNRPIVQSAVVFIELSKICMYEIHTHIGAHKQTHAQISCCCCRYYFMLIPSHQPWHNLLEIPIVLMRKSFFVLSLLRPQCRRRCRYYSFALSFVVLIVCWLEAGGKFGRMASETFIIRARFAGKIFEFGYNVINWIIS